MNDRRVVSLVPSATETLLAWGLEPIAVTRFCEQPGFASVGGTKDPDVDGILALDPDLVIMCVEENRIDDAEALRSAGVELFVFDIDDVDDVGAQLESLAHRLDVAWEVDVPTSAEATDLRAFVPIWRRPWMTLRGATYGSSVLRRIGVDNVFGESAMRYPEVTLEDASAREPAVVLAPSEPYPFTERHRDELETVAPVVFVDGKDLFWWGVRTPGAITRLREQVLRTSTEN